MRLAYVIHLCFSVYTMALIARVVGSWIPQIQHYQLFRMLAFYTDPYLNFFRKLMPPLEGRVDLSPILAFFALRVMESLLLGVLR